MTDTILVLGANGMIGRRLVPLLRSRGLNVRAATRRPGTDRTLFDWDRPKTQESALAGVNAVYLVPPAMVENPADVVGPFLDRAKRAGVTRLVVVSSMAVAFPHEPAGSGRRTLERQVRQSGLAWTILRPSGFAQNFSEGFMLPGIQAGTLATATGDGAVAFVDADDIAAVAMVALTEPGHANATYTITGPEALTFSEAVATIGDVTGHDIRHQPIASDELASILAGAGVPSAYAAMLIRDQEAIRSGAGAAVTDIVSRVSGRMATPFASYAARSATVWSGV